MGRRLEVHSQGTAVLILLDTSACVEYLRATGSRIDLAVTQLMESERAREVAICGPVLMEIQMGASGPRSAGLVLQWMRRFGYLDLREPDDFAEGGDIFQRARGEGWTVRSPHDCLIAAIAIRADAQLLHCDRDFDRLARVSPLRILDPASIS